MPKVKNNDIQFFGNKIEAFSNESHLYGEDRDLEQLEAMDKLVDRIKRIAQLVLTEKQLDMFNLMYGSSTGVSPSPKEVASMVGCSVSNVVKTFEGTRGFGGINKKLWSYLCHDEQCLNLLEVIGWKIKDLPPKPKSTLGRIRKIKKYKKSLAKQEEK